MSEHDDDDATEESSDATTLAASSTYKVRGAFSDTSGAGVQGKNTANNGTPIGVEGAVPNNPSGGYGLSTPNDARVEGSMATTGKWQVDVDGDPGITMSSSSTFTVDGNTIEVSGNNVVGHLNDLASGVLGASIGGGGGYDRTNDTSFANSVYDDFGTVGGGYNNTAGTDDNNTSTATLATVGGGYGNTAGEAVATVGGGQSNEASGLASTVAGGDTNKATDTGAAVGGGKKNEAHGEQSTVPGGKDNKADGDYSFAAGNEANASHQGTFVWADSTSTPFTSTGGDQFLISAFGGVGINTNDPSSALDVSGTATMGSATVNGTADVDSLTATSATVNNDATVGSLTASSATVNGTATMDSATVNNDATVGSLTATSSATVNGTATMDSATVNNDATVNGTLEVGGIVQRDAMTQLTFTEKLIVSPNSETTLQFDNTTVDELSAWSTSNPDYKYVCPAPGHYEVTLNVKFETDFGSESAVIPRIKVSGQTRYDWNGEAFQGESYRRSFTATIVNLRASDTLSFTIEQQSGNNKNLLGLVAGTRASIRYLGDGQS